MADLELHIDRPMLTGAETVYLHLRDGIVHGSYAPGHRFTETTLAAELDVSRTPVREALNRLKSDGLVTTARAGVRVITLTPEDVLAVYQVRAALERLVASLAAVRQSEGSLPPARVDALEGFADTFLRGIDEGDIDSAVDANLRLHEAIAAMSGNRLATDFLSRVWARMAISSASNLAPDSAWSRKAAEDHFHLARAIADGDADAADRIAYEHVTAAESIYRERLAAGQE
jgi:DNA-binding GntR family transcriptional regulator